MDLCGRRDMRHCFGVLVALAAWLPWANLTAVAADPVGRPVRLVVNWDEQSLWRAQLTMRQRMKQAPHTHQIVRHQDVELVLRRFEEEFEASLIQKRLTLDTSTATVKETLAEFVEAYQPFYSNTDLLRMKQRSGSR